MKTKLITISATLLMFASSLFIPILNPTTANAQEAIEYEIKCLPEMDSYCFLGIENGELVPTPGKLVKVPVIIPDDDPHL